MLFVLEAKFLGKDSFLELLLSFLLFIGEVLLKFGVLPIVAMTTETVGVFRLGEASTVEAATVFVLVKVAHNDRVIIFVDVNVNVPTVSLELPLSGDHYRGVLCVVSI